MDKLKEAQKAGVVVGLADVAEVVPRLDIDELLLREPDTFNLFLLALQELQNDTNSSKIMGYYQVAGMFFHPLSNNNNANYNSGIHGLPKTFWDGVFAQTKTPNNPNQSGYCVHGTIIFPTWHRPYLAMMEVGCTRTENMESTGLTFLANHLQQDA